MTTWKRYGKIALLPVGLVLIVAAGSIGGAAAFDHYASIYLWPEPENLVVQQASLPAAHETRTITFTSTFPGVDGLTDAVPLYDEPADARP